MASFAELPPEIQAQIPAAARAGLVDIQPAPGGGWLALGKDGGVFALGGAAYKGGLGGTPHLQNVGSSAARLEIDPNTGGYTIIGDKGHRYAFGTEYKAEAPAAAPNSLYRDPAFLAFLRSSDLGLETAAQDVARKQAAYQQALALAVPTMQDQGKQERQGIDNNFEARGVYRSGQREVQNAAQEVRQANAISGAQASTAENIGSLQSSLAERVAEQQRMAAEKGFSTAQQQELGQQQETLRSKYPAQFAGQ